MNSNSNAVGTVGPNIPAPVPDLQPFLIDPIILARLNRRGTKPSVFTALIALGTVVAVSWTALLSGLFFRPHDSRSWWSDLVLFIFRNSDSTNDKSVPYLRDYPSIVLTVTIVLSVGLVYGLLRGASVLHSDMEKSGCVKYTEKGRIALHESIDKINANFLRRGKRAPIVLLVIFALTITVNLLLKEKLFVFLIPGGVYEEWWASLVPLRPGGVVWVILGTLGTYMVYVESVLGLSYVRFLKKCHDDYRFKANMLNPDDFYGWSRLRQIVSNLEIGVICTLLSAWAMSFFLQPAIGSVAAAAVIIVFTGIVVYVFVQVTLNFRRQVRLDKRAQRLEISKIILDERGNETVPSLLKVLVAHQRLELVERVPSTPIRQRWLVAGALSIFGPLSAIVVQLIKYFTTN